MTERDEHSSPPSARPVPVSGSPGAPRGRLELDEASSRATSTARLASPIPTSGLGSSPTVRQVPTSSQIRQGTPLPEGPLPGAEGDYDLPGPGSSALAAALQGYLGASPPRHGTPPIRPLSPQHASEALRGSGPQSNYGSISARSIQGTPGWSGPAPLEDPEIVRRHLVQGNNPSTDHDRFDDAAGGSRHPFHLRGEPSNSNTATGVDEDEFSSLQLQGGDVTREIYKWAEDAEAQASGTGRAQRSKSFHISRPEPESEVLDIQSIKVPGGIRRNFIQRTADNFSRRGPNYSNGSHENSANGQPVLFTRNFIEFLSLYGHFAGEELEEDDEVLGPDEYFGPEGVGRPRSVTEDDEDMREPDEGSALLAPGTPGLRMRKRKERSATGKSGAGGAMLLLLKSFVGTGVLFLPKAFLNGGIIFSSVVLLFIASLSYYCFILLVNTRLKIEGSFGDIGGKLYGKGMRDIILFSIVLSQIGFASAYIVFVSESLHAFFSAVSQCRWDIEAKWFILGQLIIFTPLSFIRNISKLGVTALIADAFILLGLIYLYYYDIFTIVRQGGVADIVPFNPRDWTLFTGVAIFTFEGVGLIIPIQEAMKKPSQFPPVLAAVMVIITILFTSIGALSYAAYGSRTKTVVILNMPQDDKMVNTVQLLYSLAILLSTPLQLFPAIRITENAFFTKSGKYNRNIKWQKNLYRFFLVAFCTAVAWFGAQDLDKFVALVGSFACVPLVYVYPPLLHLKAVAKSRFHRYSDIALITFGLIAMVYTTALTLWSWASGMAKKSPAYCSKV